MNYTHAPDKAGEFSSEALGRIQKEGLSPTPDTYALWYVHFSGENPELSRAIQILESTEQDITNDHCAELYERFLSDRVEGERVRDASDRIQNTIKEVNGTVGNVRDATSRYSSTLTDVNERLGQNLSPQEMGIVLKNVMANTQDMLKQNETLEQELAKSSLVMKELQRDLELVRKEALTDSLTNLSNRKAFDAEIRRFVQECNDHGHALSLIMMDIDHFKSFNDNFGHQVGDQVLRLVARTLVEGVKGRDMAARFGGEEFAILLPETIIGGAHSLADALRIAVEKKDVVNRNTGEKMGRITLSGGVAEFMPGESVEDLIGRADAALYTAKNNGRNQVNISNAPGPKKAAG